MIEKNIIATGSRQTLLTNKRFQVGEILVLFLIAFAIIKGTEPFAGENPLIRQGVVWVANILMMSTVWLGLRLRGQNWKHFGLSFSFGDKRKIWRTVWQSIAVFVAAIAAFVIGAIIMANIVGIPEQADMGGYNYLKGNLPLLLLALVAVFIASSFGEEVIYRAFLINRLSELGGNSKFALRIAVVLSSVIFGLIHFDWGVAGIVQTGFMGLALAIAYLLVKRNLWVTILAHAYMDAILLVQMYFAT